MKFPDSDFVHVRLKEALLSPRDQDSSIQLGNIAASSNATSSLKQVKKWCLKQTLRKKNKSNVEALKKKGLKLGQWLVFYYKL